MNTADPYTGGMGLARELVEILDRSQNRAGFLDLSLARELDRARDNASLIAHALERLSGGESAEVLHHNLATELNRLAEYLHDLDCRRELVRRQASARGSALALVRDLDVATQLAQALINKAHGELASVRAVADALVRRETRRVTPSAAGLLAAAARLLPAADRARYAEEYLNELWDLAESGAGRIRQLRYALRQLRCTLSTGFALRSPRRRGVTS